jgi:RNA polymerase sigma-70 factor (ECF subfamily)
VSLVRPPPARYGAPAAPLGAAPAAAALNSGPLPASNAHAKHERAKEAEEDRALVSKAREGDAGAFRSLVERHQRRAFALAVSLVRDESDAREIVQEAFIRVYRNLDGFEGGSSFFTWLYRIVTNLSIDLLRRPGRQAADLDEERVTEKGDDASVPFLSTYDGADPADALRRREIGARLQVALDGLPPYHRAVVVLREIEGLSYEEMAQALGISKGTVMSRLFHARQKLQRALVDCYEEQLGRGRPHDGAHASPATDTDSGEAES